MFRSPFPGWGRTPRAKLVETCLARGTMQAGLEAASTGRQPGSAHEGRQVQLCPYSPGNGGPGAGPQPASPAPAAGLSEERRRQNPRPRLNASPPTGPPPLLAPASGWEGPAAAPPRTRAGGVPRPPNGRNGRSRVVLQPIPRVLRRTSLPRTPLRRYMPAFPGWGRALSCSRISEAWKEADVSGVLITNCFEIDMCLFYKAGGKEESTG